MKFFLSVFIYLAMAAVLVAGVLAAMKGNFWLLAIGFLGFILAVGKIGCASHD